MIFLKILGYIWSAPLTLAGMLAAYIGGCEGIVLWRGCIVTEAMPWGLCQFFFDRYGYTAFTWGALVVHRHELRHDADLWVDVMRHERRHTIQAMVLGPLMPIVYVAMSVWAFATGKHPYRDNWLEADARRAADRL